MNEQKKILIVEDDVSTLESLRIKFTHANIVVISAKTGKEAFSILVSGMRFDLILLDLMLPLGDGFWLLEEKRKNPDFEEIPVIVISNLNQTEHVARTRELGASGYLVKANHSLGEIASIVERCLHGGQCTFDDPGV
jgi:DNA-binding response OmpR family regulator